MKNIFPKLGGFLSLVLLISGSIYMSNNQHSLSPGVPGLAANQAVNRSAPLAGPDNLSDSRKIDTKIIAGGSAKNDLSVPLISLQPIRARRNKTPNEHENPPLPIFGHKDGSDPVIQKNIGPEKTTAKTGIIFDGIDTKGSCKNCTPPDTNGDVGPNHYVQAVNSAFAIYSKTGETLYEPADINTIWTGFGGQCEVQNDGDPIVLYDSLANRWLISQFTVTSPFNECIAISQTNDPTGAWYRYAFQLSTTDFPDYPHFGIFPSGYYMSVNWFKDSEDYDGPRPYVFDRSAMLAGDAATFQTTSTPLGDKVNSLQPADLDGPLPPADGSPGLFLGFSDPFSVYKFNANWSDPSSSSWTESARLVPAKFKQLCPISPNCIPQKGTRQKLDGIGDRFMYRLVYRNMGSYETLLALHCARGDSPIVRIIHGVRLYEYQSFTGIAGIRWYEIRNPFGKASIFQQGTYSPADDLSRWMGSIAMDKNGSIALGYSISGSSLYPGIRFTSRLTSDPLGSMAQGEGILKNGSGYQYGSERWGDYSNLSVDPADDCTFWFTTQTNNSYTWDWNTTIGTLKLPGCP